MKKTSMITKTSQLSLAIGTLFLCACAEPSQQGQGGWRGLERDGVYKSETGLLKAWAAEGPQLLWAVEDAGKGWSSPTIAGGKVFVTGSNEDGDKEVFSAYTLAGKSLYHVEYGLAWTGSFPSTRTTPTIVDGKAYVISGMGEVVCINTADGKIVWKVDGGKEFERKIGMWGTSEAALVFDNKVIYSPGGSKTTVVALDAATGATIWQSKSLDAFGSYVSPLLINHKGKQQIVGITGDNHLLGIHPANGTIEWVFDDWAVERKQDKEGRVRESINCNTPLFKDGRIFVGNGYDAGSFMVELNEDATGVKLLWRNKEFDTHIGGFVVVDDVIYGSNWIGNGYGKWLAVDWNTGVANYETAWGEDNSKIKGSIIAADGMLYIYEEKSGTVALANPNPTKFDVVSEFRITKGSDQHWAHLVIDNGVLYVRHGEALLAFKIKN
ncbi:hypothetical protein FACS189456_2980 [Bacteroidia bacterium]|nr:hypothetical protein FACS189456_2980 [Bacteroidia bacterium]